MSFGDVDFSSNPFQVAAPTTPAFTPEDVQYEVEQYKEFLRQKVQGTEYEADITKKEARAVWKKNVSARYSDVKGYTKAFNAAFDEDEMYDQGEYAVDYLQQLDEKDKASKDAKQGLDDFANPDEDYGAFSYSADQTQKLIGAGIKVLGDAFDIESVSNYAQSVIDYNEQQIQNSGYESRRKYKSLEDAYEQNGAFGVLGYLPTVVMENSLQSAGGLVFGAGALVGGTAGLTAAAGGALYSGITNLGSAQQEFATVEDEAGNTLYDPDDTLGVIATALALTGIDSSWW